MTHILLHCRFCDTPLHQSFADLGTTPLANSYIKEENASHMEPVFPLHAFVCEECFLVQLAEFESPEGIFSDYAYFSSFSESWLAHARNYVETVTERFQLTENHHIVELASNDGYLLQYFKEKNIPILGVEPAANVAEVAQNNGIPTLVKFFGTQTAQQMKAEQQQADLLIANNVLAHVPDLNDFVAGIQTVLKPNGVATLEFPHLLQLIQQNQFDTIYHEHFSYFSFITVEKVFARHGLTLFDVEELPTHGGSLRIYACQQDSTTHDITTRVGTLKEKEREAGLTDLAIYQQFHRQVQETKRELLTFLIEAKKQGRKIAAYGAPAKGNTLLNYCGVGTDFIDFTVDKSPYKQNHLLPGTRIPIRHPDAIKEEKPDYVLILPWNIKTEIMKSMAHIEDWGGQFVVPIPFVSVIEQPVAAG